MKNSIKINWKKQLDDSIVQAAYIKFVEGTLSRRGMENLLKYTIYAGPFRSLVVAGQSRRAKTLARKALLRRALIS